MMNSEGSHVERYDTETFADGRGGIALRGLPPGEAERVAEIFCSIDPWARLGFSSVTLARYLSANERGAPRYAIMAGHEVAGVICIRLNWLRGPYLQFLGILPDYQRNQLGSSVLTWLAQEAKRHREPNVWVCTSLFNSDALKFYQRHGFERAAELSDLVAPGESEILLRRRL